MKFTSFISLIPSVSAGFIIPRNLPDGQYTIDIPLLNYTHANYSAPLIRSYLQRRHHESGAGWDQDNYRGHQDWVNPTINDPTDTPPDLESPNLQEPKLMPDYKNVPPPRLNDSSDDYDAIPVHVTHSECEYSQWPFKAKDYAQARAGLFAYCDRYRVQKRTMQISLSVRGDTAVYVCNWSRKRTRHCGRAEYEFVEENVLDMSCGQLQPGYAYVKSQGKTYGRAYAWDEICTWRKKKLHKVYWDGTPRVGKE